MIRLDKMEVVQMIKSNNYKYSFNLNIMKLKVLSSLEPLNSQELQFVVGGALATVESECWEDSTSKDSYKKDTGGCSKRRDKPAIAAY